MESKPSNASGSKPVVLIVEDEDMLRELLTEVIEDLGATVYSAATADAGLCHFHKHPDLGLVITDVITPGMLTGWDLAITVHDECPTLPVIVMSGYCPPHEKDLPGNACFLKKPWSLDQMCELVALRLKG